MRIYFEKIRKRLQAGVQFFQSCLYGRFGFGSFGIVHGDGFEPGKIENSSIALQELFAQRRELTQDAIRFDPFKEIRVVIDLDLEDEIFSLFFEHDAIIEKVGLEQFDINKVFGQTEHEPAHPQISLK